MPVKKMGDGRVNEDGDGGEGRTEGGRGGGEEETQRGSETNTLLKRQIIG